METLRDFTNKPGITFDPDKTYILYAEDLAQMKENFALLNEMLSLSRQYGTSFLGAIKQGDLPDGVTDAPIPIELRGSDIYDSSNGNRGGDVALLGGVNQTTNEKGHVRLGSYDGSLGYSVSGAMSQHRFLPEEFAGEDAVLCESVGDHLVFRYLNQIKLFNTLTRQLTQSIILFRSGAYYDNTRIGMTSSTVALAANRFEATPFYCSDTIEIDRFGVNVTSGVAWSNVRLAIYDSDSNGLPGNLIYGGSNISTAAPGYVYESTSIVLEAGKQYWFCIKSSSNPTVRAIPAAGSYNLGIVSETSTQFYSVLRKSEAISTDWSSSSPFSASNLFSGSTPVSFRFRVA